MSNPRARPQRPSPLAQLVALRAMFVDFGARAAPVIANKPAREINTILRTMIAQNLRAATRLARELES